MLIEEFETLTGFYPSPDLYSVIERIYTDYDGDKHDFCSAYKYNEGGLAEKIQKTALNETYEKENEHDKKLKELEEQIKKLEEENERLAKKLDAEQEWKLRGHYSNMNDDDYKALEQSGRTLRDDEATAIISGEFGFKADLIRIIHEIPVYEINRHNALREHSIVKRPPIYDATDWHYIRFNVNLHAYELINGELHQFCD